MRFYKAKIILLSSILVVGFLSSPAKAAASCVKSSIASTPSKAFYKCSDGSSMTVTPYFQDKSKAITSGGKTLFCRPQALTGQLSCK
jgi:hypothetical protein